MTRPDESLPSEDIPSTSDRLERRIEQSIGLMMTVGGSAILVLAAATSQWVRVASLVLIIGFGACGLALGARGRKKAGQIVLLTGAWLGSVGGMAAGHGTLAPVSIVFPVLIMFGAWVGSTVVVVLSMATIVAFGVVDWATTHDLLGVHPDITPYQAFGVQAVLLVGGTALAFFTAKSLRFHVTALNGSRRALVELNGSLERQVAERTSDLQSLVIGLESFNRSVSHDLRGSLGGIGGLARLAHEALLRGEGDLAKSALPAIAEQADHSSRLVTALLSLAKVSDAATHRQAIDLRRLVGEVVDQLALQRAEVPMPSIEVAHDMPNVDADPELLRPVFANLIGNAIKFSGDVANGRVQIGAARSNGEVVVHVRDNGVGFEAEAAKRLFVPFVRLHGTRFDGHGLGLSIVRRAIERQGGRVWAESRPGQGAVFSFSLPA